MRRSVKPAGANSPARGSGWACTRESYSWPSAVEGVGAACRELLLGSACPIAPNRAKRRRNSRHADERGLTYGVSQISPSFPSRDVDGSLYPWGQHEKLRHAVPGALASRRVAKSHAQPAAEPSGVPTMSVIANKRRIALRGERGCRAALDPASLLEREVEHEAEHHHGEQGEGVAELPLELRHVHEVHAVDARDQRRREQDGRPR